MNLPFRSPSFLRWIYPTLLWRVETKSKELFLTFDDGPAPGPTDFVLDTLDRYKVKATFFCIGENIGKHPIHFQKIIDGNHAIGNHTFNHIKGWNCSVDEYTSNIAQCADVIGSNQTLFRPPYGRIKMSQIKALNNYKIIMWDVLTQDYNKTISPTQCLAGSIKAARAGSIVVFHDSYKAEKNMHYALPHFIEHFLNQGFEFKTL
jgi:peptidoglycan-N-acetylglucosamine deacetylase